MSVLASLAVAAVLNISAGQIESIAALAENCIHKPYPYALSHVLQSAEDIQTPQSLYPAFYGCFDWHSAVHAHWLLARVAHLYPDTAMADRAKVLLAQNLTAENLAGELAYLRRRPGFERPYGLAWLLQLGAELRLWLPELGLPELAWSEHLAPLEQHAAEVLVAWLAQSSLPVRVGTHAQTAFALGLAYDWAVIADHAELKCAIEAAARRFYLADRACPVAYEPSAHDFLSPCLAEADLMRRILPADDFVPWLDGFLISLTDSSAILQPAVVSDPTDGHIVHLDGLNLSRAWMMRNIAAYLPQQHRLSELLTSSAQRHQSAGLASVVDPHYAGGHWLGTFAIYLLTDRGAGTR